MTSFLINKTDNYSLRQETIVASHGAAPCNLVLNATEDNLVVVNYSSGTVTLVHVEEGILKEGNTI